MSDFIDFTDTHLYTYIFSQIEELWNDTDKDGDIEEVIEEFKTYYGNNELSIYFYDFNTEFNVFDVLKSQRFILEKCDDIGIDMEMKDIINIEGLQKQLVYWIMEDFITQIILNNQKN